MFSPYGAVVGCQTAVAHQCLKVFVSTMQFYAGLFDPRPDLAIPARTVKAPYAWWW